MIYDEIKRIRLEARKRRDTPSVEAYTYIQGEIERSGEKNPSDEKVLKILKNVHAAMVESKDVVGEFVVASLLEQHIPKQLTEEEIKGIISTLGVSTVGDVQKHFREHYPGQYSGSELTKLVKEMK